MSRPAESTFTVFRWGYWGWGNATPHLIEAVDAIEAARGFAPPVFVDARISRGVRAVGFRGDALEKRVGKDRYHWMNGLGNLAVKEKTSGCAINRPEDAGKLLSLVEECASQNRRVIFFCSCLWPRSDAFDCHRLEVSSLLRKEAHQRKVPLVVEEWPGGTAEVFEKSLTSEQMRKARSGAKSILLGKTLPPVAELGLPWGTIAELVAPKAEKSTILTGPARYGSRGWELPMLECIQDHDGARSESERFRSRYRLQPDAD